MYPGERRDFILHGMRLYLCLELLYYTGKYWAFFPQNVNMATNKAMNDQNRVNKGLAIRMNLASFSAIWAMKFK